MKVAIFKPIDEVKLQKYLHQDVLANTEIYETNVYDFQSSHPELEYFINSEAEFKIAVFYMSNLNYRGISDLAFHRMLEVADKVLFFEDECSIDTYNTIIKYNTAKYYYDIGCFINEKVQAKLEYSMYWFQSSSNFYINTMSWLQTSKYNPFSQKKYTFDIMFGTPKPHRNYISELINRFPRDYVDQLLMTNFLKPDTSTNTMHNTTMDAHKDNVWEDEMNPIYDDTNVYVEYFGNRKMHPSQVVPLKIYNESAYSVVMETYCDNEYTFFTEKTIKPIIAKRLFIIVAGQHYLKNLRALGFKTFAGIIDESYDEEPRFKVRCHMIIDQIAVLCRQSQAEVYNKILPIVTHNYNHLEKLSANRTPNYINYVTELTNKAYIEGQIDDTSC